MELLNIPEQIPIDIKNIDNPNNIDNQPFDRYFQSATTNQNGTFAPFIPSHLQSQYSSHQEMNYYEYNNFNPTSSNQPIITPNHDSNSILDMSGNGSISEGTTNSNNTSADVYNSPYTGVQNYPSTQLQLQNTKLKYVVTSTSSSNTTNTITQKPQATSQQQSQPSYRNPFIVPQIQQAQATRNEEFVTSHNMPTLEYQQHSHSFDDLKYRPISQVPQNHLYSLPPTNPLVNNSYQLAAPGVQPYPDMTSLVNSNSNIVVPLVESTFVDHRLCTVCGKRITRDMSRHMRTHQSVSRFTCKFPKSQCRHKSGNFNRPYDYKKHLLNRHFKFDNPEIRKLHNLSDKLDHWGICPCGFRSTGKDWLDLHILVEGHDKKCPFLDS